MGLTIKPVCLGKVYTTDKSVLTYLKDQGTKVVTPFIMWVITGGQKLIVVDSGPADPNIVLKEPGRELERTPDQEPLKALENIGIDPTKVDIVVATHLHWDHCANFEVFPNAEIYVQRRELEFAVAPLEVFGAVYEAAIFNKNPKWYKAASRFKIVEGDIEITPGVQIVHLPGHTPGLQGVLVNTDKAKYCIPSDTVNLYENWEHGTPPGIHVSVEDCYKSFDKIEALSEVVLPCHDIKVLENAEYP